MNKIIFDICIRFWYTEFIRKESNMLPTLNDLTKNLYDIIDGYTASQKILGFKNITITPEYVAKQMKLTAGEAFVLLTNTFNEQRIFNVYCCIENKLLASVSTLDELDELDIHKISHTCGQCSNCSFLVNDITPTPIRVEIAFSFPSN